MVLISCCLTSSGVYLFTRRFLIDVVIFAAALHGEVTKSIKEWMRKTFKECWKRLSGQKQKKTVPRGRKAVIAG